MRTKTTYLNSINGLTNEKGMLIEPLRAVPIEQRRGVIALHGHGADASVWTPGWAGARHVQALADAGYTVLSIDAGGPATFNNKAAMDAITNAYSYLTGVIGMATPKVGLYGWSMGGGNSLQWIKENPTKVACALLWAPLTDLDYHTGYPPDPAPGSEAYIAYGTPIYATNNYALNSTGHKIADEYPTWRNKCPIRIIQGLADTTVPPSKTTAFINGVNAAPGSPAPNIVEQVQLAGSDHSSLFANYLVEETVQFFTDNHVLTGVYVPTPIKVFGPESTKFQDSARTTPAVVNNDPVGSWSDLIGTQHASQATGSKQPLLKKNVLNGYDVIEFDGANDYMEATIAAKLAATTFVVARKMSALSGAGRGLIGWKVNSSNRIYMYASSSTSGFGWYANEALGVENIGGDPTQWNIICIRHPTAALVEVFLNGGAPADSFDPNDNLTSGVTLMMGANNEVAGSFGDFQFAELKRYDGSLTADQVNEIGSGLADKYALAWTDIA